MLQKPLLAANLKLIRGVLKKTQSQFAKKLDITLNQLKGYERGKAKSMDAHIVQRVADLVGVNPEDITGKLLSESDLNVFGRGEKEEKGSTWNSTQLVNGHVPTTMYIESIQEQKRILEEHNQFLQQTLQISLGGITEGQRSTLAHLKALAWHRAHTVAHGKVSTEKQELDKINSKIREYGGFDVLSDNADSGSKQRKARG